ncbi:hypothetical protein TNCT_462431 [Trichonephila clavata]|uniref:Uncharacterized protein n=1 Tax=Trichonephila clavata TaxID=2740835 RepID=A0A8X6G8Z4_TRICU|nr:hypothetical protein TNCT_462431 [Trichonephila clavata]
MQYLVCDSSTEEILKEMKNGLVFDSHYGKFSIRNEDVFILQFYFSTTVAVSQTFEVISEVHSMEGSFLIHLTR